ncbi:SemiSWEET transporter [Aestuariispira ectoiniformans]|uniref:SemiSWEET transporter n=1 Tax=Aestuariispira ectoiniformans TaxID=2775080 RepID=UPI00223B02AA|nr:SemiSWEET transporter [Aestuariispira ectoiniformans]
MDTLQIVIGYMAAGLTTFSFLPQVIKVWRTRSTRDVSLSMFLVLCCGVSLWLAYGLMLGDWPMILANAMTLALASTVVYFKIRHG